VVSTPAKAAADIREPATAIPALRGIALNFRSIKSPF
jgi:hypothetical protein